MNNAMAIFGRRFNGYGVSLGLSYHDADVNRVLLMTNVDDE